MRSIEEFINSLFKGVYGNGKVVRELKEEMRAHLVDMVKDLKGQGTSEEESLKIAFERFGDSNELTSGLHKLLNRQRRLIKFVFIAAVIFIVAGIASYVYMSKRDLKFQQEQNVLTRGVLKIAGKSEEISDTKRAEIEELAGKYDYINYIALFKIKDNPEIQKDTDESNMISVTGLYRYPYDVKKARLLYPKNVKPIVDSPDDYDLSTVVASNGTWLVQYEYKENIYGYIESYSRRMVNPLFRNDVPYFTYFLSDFLSVVGVILLTLWLGMYVLSKLRYRKSFS